MTTETTQTTGEVVAYAYEVRRVSKESGRSLGGWHDHIDEDEPSEDDWKDDEEMTHEIRNVCELVYGDDPDAETVVAYEFEYESMFEDAVHQDIRFEDPRGSDSLVEVRPLVPANPEQHTDWWESTDTFSGLPEMPPEHETVAEYRLRDDEWPKYFVSDGGDEREEEEFPPAYYRVQGPNGPVSYLTPTADEPIPTTMYSFAMEAQAEHFRPIEREATPFTTVED